MKIYFVCLPFFLAFFSGLASYAQPKAATFNIKGDVAAINAPARMVHYRYVTRCNTVMDSTPVKNGSYTIIGKIDETTAVMAYVVFSDTSIKPDQQRDLTMFLVTPGTKATVVHNEQFSATSVTGSPAHQEFKKIEPEVQKGNMAFVTQYIKDHPSSPIAVFLLQNFVIGPFLDVPQHEPLFHVLSAGNKATWSGQDLRNSIEVAKRTAIGQAAPATVQKDKEGRRVALSDFSGKYVLLDFWASWCYPCRVASPKLAKLREQFGGKNFEIWSLSLDTDKKQWLEAVAKDGINWVSTGNLLSMQQDPAAKAWGIKGLPQYFLVDPSGKILAKNLSFEELESMLAKLLG